MIRKAWRKTSAFFRELTLEYRRIEVQRVLRQQGKDWRDVSWEEQGKLEYVLYGDRRAYPPSPWSARR